MKKYLPRLVDSELDLLLEALGATVIIGPKACGKTTTGLQKSKSAVKLQDSKMRNEYLRTAEIDPSLLLEGKKPRLIDEWMDAPVLWDAVRDVIDEEDEEGLFILTSSKTIDSTKISHSGNGRIGCLQMYPMSLFESGESNGLVSLGEMFNTKDYKINGVVSQLDIKNLIFASCRGGWPSSLSKKTKAAALLLPKKYLENTCNIDISMVDGIARDPILTRAILRSYARNISTEATPKNIKKDISPVYNSIDDKTLSSYVSALERLFVVSNINAWCPSIRSASAIRSSRKIEFVDPSIAVAALGLAPEYFYEDLKTFGFIFESLCMRDLKIYSQSLGGELSYYRDRYGLEADAVLHLADGRFALVECKLGANDIDAAAIHLLKIKELISEYNSNEKQCPLAMPDLLIVLTGTQYGYTRPDGVHVVPIGTLRN